MNKIIKVGTRRSALAMAQAMWVIKELSALHSGVEFRLHGITTEGDRRFDVPIEKIGGKEAFVKDIENLLMDGQIDLAVHSMKDMPAVMPEPLVIAAYPAREDARDVVVTKDGSKLKALPSRAVVATGSARRSVFIRQLRPDIKIISLRGNIDTRINRLDTGKDFAAIVLAAAGMHRLGLSGRIAEYLPCEVFIPAPGQGALGLQIRRGDAIEDIISHLDHFNTRRTVEAERAFLETIGGDCRTPVAAYASVEGDELTIRGMSACGEEYHQVVMGQVSSTVREAEMAGRLLARQLLDKMETVLRQNSSL